MNGRSRIPLPPSNYLQVTPSLPNSASLLLKRFVFRMAEASAKRVTGDEPQGTMGSLPLRAHRERRLGTRQ